jgi:hypothetical protein
MTVYAIDPGPHTAIFWKVPFVSSFQALTLDFTVPTDMPSHLRLFRWLMDNVDPKNDKVIVESFEFRKDERDREYIDYDAGEYVGVVKLWCQLTDTYYVVQNAATAKQFWNDDKLKRVELYKLLKDRHQRDAARHWLHYDTFTQNNQEWLYRLKE